MSEYYAFIRQKKNELKHFGILGQKWGIRRWQNEDGTFNEEGKLRYFGTTKQDDYDKKNLQS